MIASRRAARGATVLLGWVAPSLVVVASLLLSSLVWGAGRPRYGGRSNVPLCSAPAALNPQSAWTFSELSLVAALHEPLLRPDGRGGLKPAALAAMPELKDGGRRVLLRLRSGLRFHDGRKVRARDLAATLRHLVDPFTASPWAWLLRGLNAARERGGAEVELELERSLPDLAWRLSAPALSPLPADRLGAPSPPGTGPYRLESSSPDAFELAPFLMHHWGRPFLDHLVMLPMSGAREQRVAFRLGRIGLCFSDLPAADAPQEQIGSPSGALLALLLHGPAAEELREVLAPGPEPLGLARFTFHRVLPLEEGGGGSHPADPARVLRARELLTALAERPDALGPLQIRVRADRSDLRAMAEAVMVTLLDLGLKVKLETLDPKEQMRRILARAAGIDLIEWVGPTGHPRIDRQGLIELAGGAGHVLPLLRVARRAWLGNDLRGFRFGSTGLPRYEDLWLRGLGPQ